MAEYVPNPFISSFTSALAEPLPEPAPLLPVRQALLAGTSHSIHALHRLVRKDSTHG